MRASLSGSLFAYQWRDTPLHNRAAGLKLCICLVCAPVCLALPLPWLVLPAVFLILLVLIARVPASSLVRIVRILVIYGLFLFFLRINFTDSLIVQFTSALVPVADYLCRLALIFLAGTVFYETTSPAEIRRLLAGPENRFQPSNFSNPASAFLAGLPELFSLTLGFIPRIFSLWQDLDRAWRSRAGTGRSVPAVWKRITHLVPALVSLSLARAADTERALRNRN